MRRTSNSFTADLHVGTIAVIWLEQEFVHFKKVKTDSASLPDLSCLLLSIHCFCCIVLLINKHNDDDLLETPHMEWLSAVANPPPRKKNGRSMKFSNKYNGGSFGNNNNNNNNNNNRSFNMVKTSAQRYKHIIHVYVYNHIQRTACHA